MKEKEVELDKAINRLSEEEEIDVDEAVTTTAPLYKQWVFMCINMPIEAYVMIVYVGGLGDNRTEAQIKESFNIIDK